MYELSNLKQDEKAQEIYRYFKKSFECLNTPPKKPNPKTLPKIPKLAELQLEDDYYDPIASLQRKDVTSLLRNKLSEKLFFIIQKDQILSLYVNLCSVLPQHVVIKIFDDHIIDELRKNFVLHNSLSFQELLSAFPQSKIDLLYTEPQQHSSLRINLSLLIHRKGDYKTFLEHPFNQKLLEIFTKLDSNTHEIPLHHFAALRKQNFILSKLLSQTTDINSITDGFGNNLLQFIHANNLCTPKILKLLSKITHNNNDDENPPQAQIENDVTTIMSTISSGLATTEDIETESLGSTISDITDID